MKILLRLEGLYKVVGETNCPLRVLLLAGSPRKIERIYTISKCNGSNKRAQKWRLKGIKEVCALSVQTYFIEVSEITKLNHLPRLTPYTAHSTELRALLDLQKKVIVPNQLYQAE